MTDPPEAQDQSSSPSDIVSSNPVGAPTLAPTTYTTFSLAENDDQLMAPKPMSPTGCRPVLEGAIYRRASPSSSILKGSQQVGEVGQAHDTRAWFRRCGQWDLHSRLGKWKNVRRSAVKQQWAMSWSLGGWRSALQWDVFILTTLERVTWGHSFRKIFLCILGTGRWHSGEGGILGYSLDVYGCRGCGTSHSFEGSCFVFWVSRGWHSAQSWSY